ncbi:hypothetical protein FEM33_01565 [Dyadobacter flavalbus]|uniref:Uncharacterized protein n=1 Tax=Dyadobacter flavalbus TaxID=2579942 RepID=A0A5M8R1L6_9BACT|nr:hypothetical protein [Dyadobacter flavalbus]KAA6441448.1 hypothetical protein FEM33_01565 [Dyadobacter flavalbus]
MKKILLFLLCINYAFAQTQSSVQTTINSNLVNPLRTVNIRTSVTAVNELAGKAATDAATALSQIAGLQAGQNPETDPTVPSAVKAITTTNISNWNTAFGWGNHAGAGYLTSGSSLAFANITGVPAYLLSSTAASTYQLLSNLSTDLTASTTKYPSVNAVNTGLGLKANLAGGNTFTGTQIFPSTTSFGNVSSTELGYLDGVTSSLQTQLDAKLGSYTETDPTVSAAAKAITSTNVTNWNTAFGWSNHASAGYVTPSSTSTFTNKSGAISQWTNDSGYLLGSTAGTTYQTLANLSTDLTASATKYPSVNAVNTGLATRATTAYVDAAVAAVTPVTPANAKREIFYEPQGNSTTINTLGLAMTAQGTATTRNVNTASLYGRSRRIGYTSGTSANAVAGVIGLPQFQVAAPFSFKGVFGIQTYDAGHRYTIGMGNTSDATVNPSTLINRIHMYADPGDLTWKVVSSGATLGTPVDLGANFPVNTATTDVYDVNFTIIPGGTTVSYTIKRLNTGDIATGTLTGLPTGVLLSPQITASNAATATSANIDVMRAMMITDN